MTNIMEESRSESAEALRHKRPTRAELIMTLIDIYGDRCFFCDRDFKVRERTIDHWMPQAWCKENGWSYEKMWNIDNLRLSCKPCNAKKGDLLPNEDGTIPSRPGRTFRYRRDKRAERAEVCTACNAGRGLGPDEVCASCNSGPMPHRYPRWAKVRSDECEHDGIFWCWACSIGIVPMRGATETIMYGVEGEEEGLI